MKSTPLGVLRKGAWDAEEDALLKTFMEMHEKVKWHQVPQKAGLNRCRKSCRLRWLNYLRPNIRRGEFDTDEVDMMIRLHKLLGNRWSLIAGRLPGRTANDVKNYRKTHHQKKSEDVITTTGASNSAVIKPRPLSFSASTLPRFTPINASDIQSIDNNNHHHHLSKPPSQPATPPGNDGIEWWKELIGEIEFREEAAPLMSSTCGSENQEAITGLWTDNRPEEDQTGWSDLWDLLNFD